ncbi:hypothetical protein H6771_03255 [Candidatus Peribacteria bacterium]|nr:hypothetical protein [Candidatus Peribacteria bacterium]
MQFIPPADRLELLYTVQDKDGKTVPFLLNRAQRHYHTHKQQRNIILKSRQLGFTTYKCIDALDFILRNPGTHALIIAHTTEAAQELFRRKVQFAWEHLPDWEKATYRVRNLTSGELRVQFPDGQLSSLQVGTTARSGTYQYIHITELSYLDQMQPGRAEEIISGAIPSLSHGGQLDIESTARGSSGYFYHLYQTALYSYTSGPKSFTPHFYNWTWDDYELQKITPEHTREALSSLPTALRDYQQKHHLTDQQITFYAFQYSALGQQMRLMRTEYPTVAEEAFHRDADQLFDPDAIALQTPREPEQITLDGWYLYAEPERGHHYAMGVDVSEGIGKDSSAAVLWDMTSNAVVATYASNRITPDALAQVVARMGEQYHMALIGVERNNHGHVTLSWLRDSYPLSSIYMEVRSERAHDELTHRLGWQTSSVTKPKMFYDLSQSLSAQQGSPHSLTINDERLLREMRSFGKQDVQVTEITQHTRHWDLLTACAIGWQMRNHCIGRLPSAAQLGITDM